MSRFPRLHAFLTGEGSVVVSLAAVRGSRRRRLDFAPSPRRGEALDQWRELLRAERNGLAAEIARHDALVAEAAERVLQIEAMLADCSGRWLP